MAGAGEYFITGKMRYLVIIICDSVGSDLFGNRRIDVRGASGTGACRNRGVFAGETMNGAL